MISLKNILLCSALCFQTVQSSYQIGPFGTKYCLSDSDSDKSDTDSQTNTTAAQLPVVIGTRQAAQNKLTVITSCIKIVIGTGLLVCLISNSSEHLPFCTTCASKK